MVSNWESQIKTFIELSDKHKVRMILVGGGAVNFHGYQRLVEAVVDSDKVVKLQQALNKFLALRRG